MTRLVLFLALLPACDRVIYLDPIPPPDALFVLPDGSGSLLDSGESIDDGGLDEPDASAAVASAVLTMRSPAPPPAGSARP